MTRQHIQEIVRNSNEFLLQELEVIFVFGFTREVKKKITIWNSRERLGGKSYVLER